MSGAKQHCSWTLSQTGCCPTARPNLTTRTPCGSTDPIDQIRFSKNKDLKDRVSFSITSVIIIDYHHHHQLHSCCLPAAVGSCQNIQVCSSSNCSPSTLRSFSSSSPQTAFLIPPLCCPPFLCLLSFSQCFSPASRASGEFSSSSSAL